jgi:hypothetical protein
MSAVQSKDIEHLGKKARKTREKQNVGESNTYDGDVQQTVVQEEQEYIDQETEGNVQKPNGPNVKEVAELKSKQGDP